MFLNRILAKSIFRCILIFTYLLIVAMVVVFYLFQSEVPRLKPEQKKPPTAEDDTDEMSCHYLKEKDALPPLDKTMTFPPNSIFFVESSCKGLTSRQACSIESAAKANPEHQINVLFTSPVTWDMFKSSAISTLLSIPNVEAARIHLEEYAEGTPLHTKLSKTPLTHEDLNMDISDVLKFLTMYKYSGIYLGLDVIVARPFKDLGPNWVVKETPASLSSDMFSFSENKNGRALADIALNILYSDLALLERQDLWSFDSPTIMRKLMHLWCGTADVLYLTSSMCQDVEVLEPENFFPISFHDRQNYFKPGEWEKWKKQKIYTYQLWDRFTKYHIVTKNTLYGKIAKEYCPTIYNFYGDKFGSW